jgi:hypothetical protein
MKKHTFAIEITETPKEGGVVLDARMDFNGDVKLIASTLSQLMAKDDNIRVLILMSIEQAICGNNGELKRFEKIPYQGTEKN